MNRTFNMFDYNMNSKMVNKLIEINLYMYIYIYFRIRQSNVNTKLKIASSSQHLMENNGTENNYIEEHVFKIQVCIYTLSFHFSILY